ncbi:hypothetical protein BCV71DRAFT_164710, partial [Rhizopus microsporus]
KIFQDHKVSKSIVYNFARTKCNLSVKKAQFQPAHRNSKKKKKKSRTFRLSCSHSAQNLSTNNDFRCDLCFRSN